MGFVLNWAKRLGIIGVMTTEGTVFGGKTGDGVLGKIILIFPGPEPKPPVPHGNKEGKNHYPEYKLNSAVSQYLSGLAEPYRMQRREHAYSF